MQFSTETFRYLEAGVGSRAAALEIQRKMIGLVKGTMYYVDAQYGSNVNDGLSEATAVQTVAQALSLCATGDTIGIWGDVREQISGSNLKFDITIIGLGSLHHPDQPGTSTLYATGGALWRAPASPAATTPLLTIRGRGWKIINIMFDCPADAAAIRLARNSLSDVSEYDASHASIIGCDFRSGLYGIEDYDGCFNVTVEDCVFETLDATATAAAIKATSGGGPASPRRWRILNNFFQPDSTTNGNSTHIVIGLVGSLIKGNVFGLVNSTGYYIDLTNGGVGTPGSYNVICNNVCADWEAANYRGGTGDQWLGNHTIVDAQTSPSGLTVAVAD